MSLEAVANRVTGTLPKIANAQTAFRARIGHFAELKATFGETEVKKFAQVSGDWNPLHLDEAIAAESRFKGRIVHGMLVSSTISTIFGVSVPGAVYVSQTFRFRRPVYLDDEVTARIVVEEADWEKQMLTCSTTCSTNRHGVVVSGEAKVYVPSLTKEDAE